MGCTPAVGSPSIKVYIHTHVQIIFYVTSVHVSERVCQVAAQNENRRMNFVIFSPVVCGLMRSLKLAICFAVMDSLE